MARTRPIAVEDELLELARERVELPPGKVWLDYEPDVDLLYVRLKEKPRPDRTEDDQERGLIYHYEGKELVSIEVLDLYGVFAS